MSPIASDGGGGANDRSIGSDLRPQPNQGSTPVKTPRKQQQQSSHQKLHTSQAHLPADEPPPARTSTPRRLHPGTGRTATAPDQNDSECATPTPAPHRYGLRARRASRGSFSTPSRRQQQQQQLTTLLTPTRTSGTGAAAICTGSPLSYGIDL
ncbi:hypothetical protein V8C44DRAFT_355198 [Trichoderma aethiopicum]